MSEWGTPPGLVDNETRSDSPSNDMRAAQLQRQRRLREQQEKKKMRHQLGKIERNDVSSGRKRDGKTPLVVNSSDPSEGVSRYAYDNPEAYSDNVAEPVDSQTQVKVVNVAPPDLQEESDPETPSLATVSAPTQSQSQSSLSSFNEPGAGDQPIDPRAAKKERKREREARRQAAELAKLKLEEEAKNYGSDDEDELETAVIPESNAVNQVKVYHAHTSYDPMKAVLHLKILIPGHLFVEK